MNIVIYAVLLDHSKTFDSTFHQIFFGKTPGIETFSPSAVDLINDLITTRIQYRRNSAGIE